MAHKRQAKNTPQLHDRSKGMPPGTKERAQQDPDRGRLADTPSDIPAAGWKDILWRVCGNIGKGRVVGRGAGGTFYSSLALFPALAAVVAVYGLLRIPKRSAGGLDSLSW